MRATKVRASGTVILVLAALLGSAYALGRSLVPEQPQRSNGVTASRNQQHYAEQPPATDFPAPATVSPSRSAEPQQAGGDGDGPDGSWITTGTSRVALTFDDGPDPQYTPQVLALLNEYGVKATFCVVGQNAQEHPDLIQAIVAEGHTVCNHSWSHDVDLGSRSPDTIRADLLRTSDAIRAAVPNARIAYFRQPGGNWTHPVVSVAEELGMTPLHWAVDPTDWQLPGPQKIITTVLTETRPGSIVLMHDAGGDRSGTVAALHYLLPALLDRFQLEALPTGTT
ncbi:polysaccharide deacetylase family protein [Micromonospora soli]|uniref:polysaccharide deacetylase family protein n=1 Tax=Micromonospora sp. NBRC 110009 TaxID=3061627 RepID=UPI002673F5F2|nr:polysaccharide deacetylase family protein [Micromonospora sp. NBRC 110009]WKU02178.1 polysaccharide deacetylase family protein [Micromonospora sp. NBRC 110009]